MGAAAMSGSWADLLSAGRLPRFVLICLAVWLNAADSLVTERGTGARRLRSRVCRHPVCAGCFLSLRLKGAEPSAP
jgi:hypothetical protein